MDNQFNDLLDVVGALKDELYEAKLQLAETNKKLETTREHVAALTEKLAQNIELCPDELLTLSYCVNQDLPAMARRQAA